MERKSLHVFLFSVLFYVFSRPHYLRSYASSELNIR